MVPDPTKNSPDADALERGYEARDVGVRVIFLLLGGFAVLFGVLLVGLYLLTNHELAASKEPVGRSVVTKTTVGRDAPPLQPQPGHQSLDAWDLAKMRSQEDTVFKAMGWTMNDRTHRFDVPASVVAALQSKPRQAPATTRPVVSLAPSPSAGEAKAQATLMDRSRTDERKATDTSANGDR